MTVASSLLNIYKNLADAEVKRSLSSQIQFMQGT